MDAFIGEIRAFTWGWYPDGWLPCDGSTFSVQQFQALYAVIGNTFGGTANQNFQVPNLSGLALVSAGQGPGLSNYPYAKTTGAPSITLNNTNLPAHTHVFNGAVGGATSRTSAPTDNTFYISNFGYKAPSVATIVPALGYVSTTPNTSLISTCVGQAGTPPANIQAHDNRQPSLTINYCICWEGVFPVHPN